MDYLKLFEQNFKVSKKCAAEGMVLLKNEDGCLPLKNGAVIAPIGRGCYNFIKGGGGSADVKSPYVKSLIDGLEEKQRLGRIKIADAARSAYGGSDVYSADDLYTIGGETDTVIFTVSRFGTEGSDRNAEKGDFYLSDEETALLDMIEKCDKIKNIIAVLNIPSIIDVKWINTYSKIKAALIAWLPGMEGGTAAADILCGDVTPCGKLTDTFAMEYSDYPSALGFKESPCYVRYEEDIFNGYRYFETFEKAKSRVVYPFGYGLSYTEFEYSNIKLTYDAIGVTVKVDVKNIGKTDGKEIVQCYINAPKGLLAKPKYELKAYGKTGLLAPGERQTLTLSFDIESMASFDDTGTTGFLAAYVLESGVYNIFIGGNIRALTKCGSIFVDDTYAVKQLSLKLVNSLDRRMNSDGDILPFELPEAEYEKPAAVKEKPKSHIMLKDVADGKAELDSFIAQLDDKELINLLHAQPPTFPRGTAGIGNLKKYGIPSAQTADGPSGLRKSTPTTCFPCSTLVGCTWNTDIQFELGAAIGFEGIKTGIDILLAPGLNIHRDPLCGRNFEYFSEDPLVSGCSAAAIVNGVQSRGMAATVKHFAANGKEENRYDSNSVVSERALREIYLKGFEIAVKKAQPWFVMSSYNLVNGTHTSENYNLLTAILRDEWGFEGAVMTDWRNHSHQWREIRAGNNIKMPFGYPEELALTYEMLKKGSITRGELESAARPVLKMLMKTDIFKRQYFGREYNISGDEKTVIKAVDFTGVSATLCAEEPCLDEGGGYNMCEMGKDMRNMDAYLIYDVDINEGGKYTVSARIAGPYDTSYLEFTLDDKTIAKLHYTKTGGENEYQCWQIVSKGGVFLPEGKHTLKVIVRCDERGQGININYFTFEKE